MNKEPEKEYGLIVQQGGKAQCVLAKFVVLLLNYQYGIYTKLVGDFVEAASAFREFGPQIRCTFIIQNERVRNPAVLMGMTRRDTVPLFLLVPESQIAEHRKIAVGLNKVELCAWEGFSGKDGNSLRQRVANAFKMFGVTSMLEGTEGKSYQELQQLVENRLRELKSLPSLPEVVMRIMKIVNDPDGSIKDLETVLFSDPSIVKKLLQVFNSAAMSGAARQKKWTVKEGIMRLGMRKVGAIAAQVKMMNSFARPEDSKFDLRGFWEHSVGCALVADALCTKRLVTLKREIEFNDYWIAALLHDVGKLILGFYFWDQFEQLLNHMGTEDCSYRTAEMKFQDIPTHEYVGSLVMLKSNAGEELVDVVGSHHTFSTSPRPLACLVHLSNNLIKDMGRGYIPGEPAEYDPNVLRTLGLNEAKVAEIREQLEEELEDQINEIVEQCMG